MVNYQNGKVYKIVSDQTDQIYVGSTCLSLAQRLAGHKSNYKTFLKRGTHFITSFDIVKYDDCKIILIEVFPCDQRCELEAREYYHMKGFENKVNTVMPTRTSKQHYQENKELYQEKNKNYNEGHPDYNKDYYKDNKDSLVDKRKKYYHDNKEQISQKRKMRYLIKKSQQDIISEV